MAEEGRKKKPLSLNERTNLLLADLSRSRPSKPPPPPGEEKVHKVRLEGRRRLCKVSSEPSFDNGFCFDSPSPPPPPPPKKEDGDGDQICAGEEKVHKDKLEGRRRPCKVSSEPASDDCVFGNGFFFDSPSPLPPLLPPKKEGGEEEQIRDILSDLTSRLECLSMEKPKPKPKPRRDVVACDRPIVAEMDAEEFGSASSSLSAISPDAEEDTKKGKYKGKEVEELVLEDDDVEDECVVIGSGDKQLLRGDGSCVVDVSDDDFEEGNFADEENGEDIMMEGSGCGKSSKYVLPGKVAKILYPHQREGLRWLWSLHCGGTGGILGDDMGLGKTMQIASYLTGLFHSRLIKRAMIVAPKTLLSHWIKELTTVGLSEKIKDYFGTSAKLRNYELDFVLQEGGVLLTTYDIVRNNFKSIRGDFYSQGGRADEEITWDYVILDEGHIIKNPSTQRAKSLLEIPSSHRIIISGTPIQNNLKELWALFSFCCPTVLGDKQQFKDRYEHKILRGNEKIASDREKYIGSTAAKELRERIKPYFLRRLKSEVFTESDTTAKLSRKNELIVWLRLSHVQRKLYEAFLNSELVHASFDGSPLAAITILKKICDHPLLLTKRAAEEVLEGMDTMLNKEDLGMVEEMATNLANMTRSGEAQHADNNVSCKITFILLLMENLVSEGHTVLIFSQTRKMLNLIQEAIASKGYRFLRIDGTTKMSDREKTVNEFQAGEAPIFLLTSRVGGLGLTLTKADRVIVADPAWNPSTDSQSVDRAYRIGQKKDVLVYRLMTCGTIEEKIYKMQVFKGGLFKIATEQKDQTRYFSTRDLKELFSLPNQGFDVSLTQQQLHEEHDNQHHMVETLVTHIRFLEKQGIAGVSHHSLLFSKSANVPIVQIDEEEQSLKRNVITKRWPYNSKLERDVDGAVHAFNPKTDRAHFKGNSQRDYNEAEGTRKEIEDKIKRLSQALANNGLISRLPDSGDKIRKQISQLKLQLTEMESPVNKTTSEKPDVVDLDDLAEELQRGLFM